MASWNARASGGGGGMMGMGNFPGCQVHSFFSDNIYNTTN